MLFSYSLQIFPEVFFLFSRKPSGFAWASQPHRPYPEPLTLPLWPPSLSIAGAKVDTFYLPAKCFTDFFWSIFYPHWMSGGYKGRKKRGTYRVSPFNPVSAPSYTIRKSQARKPGNTEWIFLPYNKSRAYARILSECHSDNLPLP